MSPRLALHAPPMYERCRLWLLKTGTKRKVEGERLRRPFRGMSPATVNGRMDYILRLHTDLGYLTREDRGAGVGDRFVGVRGKDPQRIGVAEVLDYIARRFPADRRTEPLDIVHDSYVLAARTWADFGHFEMGSWSEEKVLDLQQRLPYRVNRQKLGKIDTEPPERIDPWVAWLPDGYGATKTPQGWIVEERFPGLALKLHAVAVLMGHCGGMRVAEARSAPWGLDGKTLKVDDGTATIWGKGPGGLSKKREAPWHPHVAGAVKRYREWVSQDPERLAAHERHDRLFLNDDLGPYNSERSIGGAFKEAARRYNEVVLKPRAEAPLDLALIHTHAIGRHRFGTYWANLPMTERPADSVIMEWMGIEDHKIFRRYVNVSRGEQAKRWAQVADPLHVQSGPGPAATEPTNGAVLERMDALVKTVENLSRQLQEERDRNRELTDRLLGGARKTRRLPSR